MGHDLVTALALILGIRARSGALVAGPEEEPAQPYLDFDRLDDDALAALESAVVRYRIAVGPIAGPKTGKPALSRNSKRRL